MLRSGPTPHTPISSSIATEVAAVFEKYYTVTRIEGEYAYLRDNNAPDTEELFLALALLPPGTDVGTTLHYINFTYEIV